MFFEGLSQQTPVTEVKEGKDESQVEERGRDVTLTIIPTVTGGTTV